MLLDSKELREIINKNPTLPILFVCDNEMYYDEFHSSVASKMRVKIGKATTTSYMDITYDDPDDLHEAIWECMSSNPDYDHLSDAEFEEEVDKEFNKYEWQDAIIVYLS